MDWLRYTRIAIYTGIFAIPFIALIVADALYFPFITGKGFAFRIIVELMFGLWVFVALYQAEYRPRKALALWLGGAFVLAIGISTVLAENPVKAFWSNFERMEGYITIIHLAMYVLVLTSMMKTEELWRRFFLTSLGVSCIVAAYSVLQLFGAFTINQGGLRIDATFGNATYFAVYMLINAFLALYALMRWSRGSRTLQVIFGSMFFLYSVLVFYSATRGSILGLAGGLFLAGLIALVMGSGRLRTIGVSLVAVVIVVGGIFYSVKDTDFVRNHPVLTRVASISLSEGAVRFKIWEMAYQGFKERPVFGWGQDGFNYVFNKYYKSELVTQEPWFDRAHNIVLDWLVAGGLVGALLYLSLYAVLLYYLWRPGTTFDISERAILTGLLAGYAFHNLFVFDNLLSYIMFMLLFSYITVRSVPDAPASEGISETTIPIAAPIIAVVTLVIMYFVNVPGYSTGSDLISGLRQQPGGVTKNLDFFKQAAARGGLGHQEAGEQFLQFALQVRGMNIGDQAFQLGAANAARDAFKDVLVEAPNDARLLVFYGSFLRQFGDLGGSAENLQKALALSPLKQGTQIEVGLSAFSQKEYPTALKSFKEVYDSAPEFGQVRVLYAATAIAAGQQALATQLLVAKYGTDEPQDVTILQAYVEAKQYAKAIRIAEKRVSDNPKDVSVLKFLAGVYIQAGQRAAAIEALQRAIALEPAFKAEGEQYIAQINAGKI